MDATVQKWTVAEQDQIRVSVANILDSVLFSGSPRQQRFLQYLVANSLKGDFERLKGYTIAVEVFDRRVDFDPSLDSFYLNFKSGNIFLLK